MDVLASGYPSLDYIFTVSHSPTVGSTALILRDPDLPTYGGCGANVAVGLSRLGHTAGVGMIIGDDAAGRGYTDYLRERAVDTQNVIVVSETKTSYSYLFRNPQGEYQNFFFAGAADVWQGTLRLHGLETLAYGLVTVAPFAYNRQFVELLREVNVPLIWQLKPDIYAYPREAMLSFARSSRVILMNRIEADYLTACLELDDLRALLAGETQTLVVTQGAAGAVVHTHEGTWSIPAVAVSVVDPVGAGDGFTTGFIAGLLRGHPPAVSARWGAVVASFVLEQTGCQTNLPDETAFQRRYKEHFGSL